MKRQFPLILCLVTLAALFTLPACRPEQLERADRAFADVNAVGAAVRHTVESPAGVGIPSPGREIAEILSLAALGGFGIWQRIRASKILEKSQAKSVTLRAIVDSIDQADPKAADSVKTQILATMMQRRVHDQADAIVDEHRSIKPS